MARSLTNKSSFRSAIETALGVAGTAWTVIEVNTITDYGADVTNTPREPITSDRQRRKGSTTDLDSAFGFEGDLTLSHAIEYSPAFVFADYVHVGTKGSAGDTVYNPTAVVDGGGSPDEYTVAANGDLAADELIFARGFGDTANNGLKLVVATSTGTAIKVATGSLVADGSPNANAEVAVCGVQGASGDLAIDASGDLTSATANFFSDHNLSVGQFIKIGGTAANTFFATAANNDYARIDAISDSPAKLTLSKRGGTFVADTGVGKTIQLFYGRFLRNVDVDNSDYLEQSYTFEATLDSLDTGPADMYGYAKGNYCNEMTVNLPLADKATMSFGFIGTDTDVPVSAGSRKSGASTAVEPNRTELMNTSADIARLRITQTDESGALTDFKNLSMTFGNGVSPEKVLATLGAAYMNVGLFMVDIEATMLITDETILTAIRNNTTMTMDFILANSDGALVVDLPSMVIGGGALDFPVNESVTTSFTVQAFKDATLNTSIGMSFFPHIPS